MILRPPTVLLVVFLSLSLWVVLLGWLVSPWLEMYGLVVLLVLVLVTREGGNRP